jgi:hypothetical protein
MLLPMIPLTLGIAILDELTLLTRLETSAPLLAAIGTAADRSIAPHHDEKDEKENTEGEKVGGAPIGVSCRLMRFYGGRNDADD